MAYISSAQSNLTRKINVLDSNGGTKTFTYTSKEWPIGSLGSSKYPHYAVFFINDTLKSTQDGLVQNNFIAGTKTSGTGISTVANNAITTIQRGTITAVNAIKSAAGVDATTQVNPVTWTNTKKRLKQCICLPMPQKVRANYSAAYSTTDDAGLFGTIAAALSGQSNDSMAALGMAAAPTAVGMVSKAAQAGASMLPVLGGAGAAGIAAVTPSGNLVKQMLSKITGKVINKRQEQLFENMEFRTHQFSYLFIPRSKTESDAITGIIKDFKMYMHPELNSGQGSSLLITPAEFDIEFRFLNDENTVISRIATCALISCEVNYTAIGEFVAFKDTPNPIAISLELTFRELEPLTRDMIIKGF